MNNLFESNKIATANPQFVFTPVAFFRRNTIHTFNKTLTAAIVSTALLSGCGGGGVDAVGSIEPVDDLLDLSEKERLRHSTDE